MKKLGSALRAVLPHMSIICAMMILIFIVIDHFNRYIGFMSHDMTKWLIVIWVFISISVSVMQIASQRREYMRGETYTEPMPEESRSIRQEHRGVSEESEPEAEEYLLRERHEMERPGPSRKTPSRGGRHVK